MTAVLFAPHQDDESLFAAHVCLRDRPLVVVVLRSHAQGWQGVTAEEREAETAAATAVLGCEYEQWPYPDIDPPWGQVEERMQKLGEEMGPGRVWAPAYDFDANGHVPFGLPERYGVLHHDYVGLLAERVFGDRVRFYQTYTRWGGRVREGERVPLSPAEAAVKEKALRCYATQIRLDSTGWHFAPPYDEEWMKPRCLHCLDTGHVCENHPDRPWSGIADVEACCGGAGMPCPACCSEIPADGSRSIVEAFIPDADR